MRKVAVGTLALALAGCGGSVATTDPVSNSQGGASSYEGGPGGAAPADAGSGEDSGALARDASGGTDAHYVDPGCPPAKHVDGVHECDPYQLASGCGVGDRCVPYVTYADRCQTEETGTRCAPAGKGTQGDDCSVDDCSAGYVCVSAGAGFECARLCTLIGAKDDCPPGLVCAPLDVDGFFVCG